jgi:hypothetical protein
MQSRPQKQLKIHSGKALRAAHRLLHASVTSSTSTETTSHTVAGVGHLNRHIRFPHYMRETACGCAHHTYYRQQQQRRQQKFADIIDSHECVVRRGCAREMRSRHPIRGREE